MNFLRTNKLKMRLNSPCEMRDFSFFHFLRDFTLENVILRFSHLLKMYVNPFGKTRQAFCHLVFCSL